MHKLRYGSYGDEVAISGRKRTRRLEGLVLKIISQEGFKTNPEKTHVMDRSQRQQLTGIVVNKKPSIGRAEYRELRAIVHNCRTKGPELQNRIGHSDFRMHLQGKIANLGQVNPTLGKRLLEEFRQIQWV
jgi:retron-type reverse transcriptase